MLWMSRTTCQVETLVLWLSRSDHKQVSGPARFSIAGPELCTRLSQSRNEGLFPSAQSVS